MKICAHHKACDDDAREEYQTDEKYPHEARWWASRQLAFSLRRLLLDQKWDPRPSPFLFMRFGTWFCFVWSYLVLQLFYGCFTM
jgi:hypothetical protein